MGEAAGRKLLALQGSAAKPGSVAVAPAQNPGVQAQSQPMSSESATQPNYDNLMKAMNPQGLAPDAIAGILHTTAPNEQEIGLIAEIVKEIDQDKKPGNLNPEELTCYVDYQKAVCHVCEKNAQSKRAGSERRLLSVDWGFLDLSRLLSSCMPTVPDEPSLELRIETNARRPGAFGLCGYDARETYDYVVESVSSLWTTVEQTRQWLQYPELHECVVQIMKLPDLKAQYSALMDQWKELEEELSARIDNWRGCIEPLFEAINAPGAESKLKGGTAIVPSEGDKKFSLQGLGDIWLKEDCLTVGYSWSNEKTWKHTHKTNTNNPALSSTLEFQSVAIAEAHINLRAQARVLIGTVKGRTSPATPESPALQENMRQIWLKLTEASGQGKFNLQGFAKWEGGVKKSVTVPLKKKIVFMDYVIPTPVFVPVIIQAWVIPKITFEFTAEASVETHFNLAMEYGFTTKDEYDLAPQWIVFDFFKNGVPQLGADILTVTTMKHDIQFWAEGHSKITVGAFMHFELGVMIQGLTGSLAVGTALEGEVKGEMRKWNGGFPPIAQVQTTGGREPGKLSCADEEYFPFIGSVTPSFKANFGGRLEFSLKDLLQADRWTWVADTKDVEVSLGVTLDDMFDTGRHLLSRARSNDLDSAGSIENFEKGKFYIYEPADWLQEAREDVIVQANMDFKTKETMNIKTLISKACSGAVIYTVYLNNYPACEKMTKDALLTFCNWAAAALVKALGITEEIPVAWTLMEFNIEYKSTSEDAFQACCGLFKDERNKRKAMCLVNEEVEGIEARFFGAPENKNRILAQQMSKSLSFISDAAREGELVSLENIEAETRHMPAKREVIARKCAAAWNSGKRAMMKASGAMPSGMKRPGRRTVDAKVAQSQSISDEELTLILFGILLALVPFTVCVYPKFCGSSNDNLYTALLIEEI